MDKKQVLSYRRRPAAWICVKVYACESWQLPCTTPSSSSTSVQHMYSTASQQGMEGSCAAVSSKLNGQQLQLEPVHTRQILKIYRMVGQISQLIGTLDICGPPLSADQDTIKALQQVIALSLRAARSTDAVGHSAAQLYIKSYTSSLPATAGLLAALPSATLTHLSLGRLDSSNWYSGLAQLTGLQQMTLNFNGLTTEHPAAYGYLPEIAKLQQLTGLDLHHVPNTGNDMGILPVQLKELAVNYSPSPSGTAHDNESAGVVARFQHLTCLQTLCLSAKRLAAGSSVPPNLHYLYVDACFAAGAVAGLNSLQQVTSIEIDSEALTDNISSADLRLLAQLPRVLAVSLCFGSCSGLLELAAVWSDLPLCSLRVWAADPSSDVMTFSSMQKLVRHISSATKLTKLILGINVLTEDPQDAPRLAVCQHLTSLRSLKALCLRLRQAEQFVEQDAQHLSALVTLTNLELSRRGCGPYIDAATMCMLAVNLTNLKELRINANASNRTPGRLKVQCTSSLRAVGKLIGLETLWLESLSTSDAEKGLQMLTALTNLTDLKGFENAGQRSLEGFWATIAAHTSLVSETQQHSTAL